MCLTCFYRLQSLVSLVNLTLLLIVNAKSWKTSNPEFGNIICKAVSQRQRRQWTFDMACVSSDMCGQVVFDMSQMPVRLYTQTISILIIKVHGWHAGGCDQLMKCYDYQLLIRRQLPL